MVQIIPNWSALTGVVQTVKGAPVGDFVVMTLRVETVAQVAGFADLLAKVVGTEIEVMVPSTLAVDRKLVPGATVRCQVRRADLRRNFVHTKHLDVGPASEEPRS